MRISDVRRRLNVREWLALLGVVLAAFVFTAVHVANHEALSPVDEYAYLDYLDKVPTQGIVGDSYTDEFAREAFLCHGTRGFGGPHQDCDSPAALQDDDAFPIDGRTSAGIYSPAYFWITWAAAQPFTWAGLDPIVAFRFTGGIWLAAAAALMFFALRRLGVGLVSRSAGVLLMTGSLGAYWAHTYVSTDATALPAGAALLLVALRILDGQRHGWLLPVVAALASLAKLQNLAAVGLISLFLVLAAVADGARAPAALWRTRAVRLAVAAVAAGLLAQVIWVVYRSLTADGSALDLEPAYDFGPGAVFGEAFRFLPSLDFAVQFPSAMPTTADNILSGVLGLLGTGGVVGLLFVARHPDRHASLAEASLVAALIVGPLLAVATYVVAGYYVQLPVRYGLSMLPAFLACTTCLFDRRPVGRAAVGSVAAVAYVVALSIPNA
ncbi:MAG: hypothetical protein J0H23_02060 [Micrococcales bacterium]|nr:hypothetical protein [Micrococcales bacterium]